MPVAMIASILDVGREPRQPVFWEADGTLVRMAEFRRMVTLLTGKLRIDDAAVIALCFEHSGWMAAALLAAIYARKSVVIPHHHRPMVLREHTDGVDRFLADMDLELGKPFWNVRRFQDQDRLPELPPWPETGLVIFQTSGSTGTPKSIPKQLDQLERENTVHANHWGLRLRECRVVGTTSHQHLYGLQFRVLLPLSLGCPFNAKTLEYQEELRSFAGKRYALISSPAFLKRLAGEGATPVCEFIVSAGGVLPPETAHRAREILGMAPFEIYGSTEAGAIGWRDTGEGSRPWRPFPGVAVECDPEGRLWVRSDFLPDDSLLRTDDRGSLCGDGFVLEGRMDRILKIEEKRISLDEVEHRIQALPFVKDAAVVPIERNSRVFLGAVMVLADSGIQLRETLGEGKFMLAMRRHLFPVLESVAVPRHYRVVDAIPLNSMGKREIAELRALFQDAESHPGVTAPKDSPDA